MDQILRLSGVSVAFAGAGEIHPVLQELDLEIVRGEWLSIVGRNGSGKSTLGRVLAGLLPVSKGTVEREAGRVQLVFQNPDAQIVGETVWEDVCFGLENLAVAPEEMPKRVEAALGLVGLLHKKHADVTMLSGGQKQLLAVAGCLAMEAEMLVFDEATSMLDPESRARLLQVAGELHRAGRTVLWITQWMDEVAHAERVLALDAGRVVFDGTPEVFFYGEQQGIPSESEPRHGVEKLRVVEVTAVSRQSSPCEELDFAPPYVVQVARELERRGVALRTRPLLPTQLGEVVR